MKADGAFNVRFIATLGMDRLYRVYLSRGELFFIKIGGQGGVEQAVAAQFGLLGMLLQGFWSKKSQAQQDEKLQQMDRLDPRGLLGRDKNNVRLAVAEVAESSIEPAARVAMHGPHEGIWKLRLRDGKKMTLQFEQANEMREALGILPPLFGQLLTVNVR